MGSCRSRQAGGSAITTYKSGKDTFMSNAMSPSLHDIMTITSILNRYCQALNQADWDRFASVFAPDATWMTGGTGLPEQFIRSFQGRDEIVSSISKNVSKLEMVVQMNHAPVISVSGDNARAVSTFHEILRADAENGATLIGTFRDELVRSGDSWLILNRYLDFSFIDLVVPRGLVISESRKPLPDCSLSTTH